jgi:site-specific DNA-adenine methylase
LTENWAERIKSFSFPHNLHVKHQDFIETLSGHSGEFFYCDPPYYKGGGYYGVNGEYCNGFNHEMLRDLLSKEGLWVLSYGDCEEVRDLYTNFRLIELKIPYGNRGQVGRELLIFGDDVRFLL